MRLSLSRIRAALSSEIQKKYDEADQLDEQGRPDRARDSRRIAGEWTKVYKGSEDNE